jgi:preprotein translocase subunit YajC
MKTALLAVAALGLALGVAAAQDSATPAPNGQQGGGNQRAGGRGWGGMMGRGIMGTVTAVASDHITIKTESGEVRTVNYSANTRFVKQAPRPGGAGQNGAAEGGERGQRTPPEPIKAADIKLGDAIAASGEVDPTGNSVGAVMVMQLDPQRAQQMREMQANFGKTWLMGKVTAVNETKVTLQSPVDNAAHTFAADENTSFRKRRESVTLADVQVGDNVRVEGAMKDGVFVASTVSVMGMPPGGGGADRPNGPPQQ